MVEHQCIYITKEGDTCRGIGWRFNVGGGALLIYNWQLMQRVKQKKVRDILKGYRNDSLPAGLVLLIPPKRSLGSWLKDKPISIKVGRDTVMKISLEEEKDGERELLALTCWPYSFHPT